MNVNKQCLEKILAHLTKLICLTEFENIKDLDKLVNMTTSVSAQLLAIDEEIDGDTELDEEENEEDDTMTSSEIKNYINTRHGELCTDEILHIIDVSRNPQIDHINYENGKWQMWDNEGAHFEFRKRDW